jgi:protein SCO1
MRTRSRRSGGAVLVGVLCAVTLAACSSVPGPPPASVGSTSNRAVLSVIRQLPLTNQHGQQVDLAAWPGRTVLLVPFLTLCTDICPMTTGVLLQVERALAADDASSKVQIVEMSVDPGRDTPARLAAYASLTGVKWQLVTEDSAVLDQITKFFGFTYQIVPEDNPPSIDWWTGKPLTYDVDHSDGFVVINPNGVERFVTAAAPDFHGTLNPTLEKFLDDLGRQHLAHPPSPSYSPATILQALGWSMQRDLPAQGS